MRDMTPDLDKKSDFGKFGKEDSLELIQNRGGLDSLATKIEAYFSFPGMPRDIQFAKIRGHGGKEYGYTPSELGDVLRRLGKEDNPESLNPRIEYAVLEALLKMSGSNTSPEVGKLVKERANYLREKVSNSDLPPIAEGTPQKISVLNFEPKKLHLKKPDLLDIQWKAAQILNEIASVFIKKPVPKVILITQLAAVCSSAVPPTVNPETELPPPVVEVTGMASPTAESGLVGIETPIPNPSPEVNVTATPEGIFPPSPWQIPTVEQASLNGSTVYYDNDTMPDFVVGYVKDIMDNVPGVKSVIVTSNGKEGKDYHWSANPKSEEGYLWSSDDGGKTFKEYPVRWDEKVEYIEGQTFALVPDSKDAVIVFADEKPVLVKNLVDGRYLEVFNPFSGEWELNSNVLGAMLPNQSLDIWQDENGNYQAGKDSNSLYFFNTETGEWQTTQEYAEILNAEEIVENVRQFLEKEGQYSDEALSPKLYKPKDGEDHGEINQLGMIDNSLGQEIISIQEVLLGGVVKGDDIFLVLGTQDQNKNRFVHVGYFPTNYFDDGKYLWVGYLTNSSVYAPSNIREFDRIGETMTPQEFLDKYTGEGVISSMFVRRDQVFNQNAKTDAEKEFLEKVYYSTLVRSQGIANRVYKVASFLDDFETNIPGNGSDKGIYSLDMPLTVDNIMSFDFDPESVSVIIQFDTRKK